MENPLAMLNDRDHFVRCRQLATGDDLIAAHAAVSAGWRPDEAISRIARDPVVVAACEATLPQRVRRADPHVFTAISLVPGDVLLRIVAEAARRPHPSERLRYTGFTAPKSREEIARILFERFKARARQSFGYDPAKAVYSEDEWENLPASFTRSFYEDADAVLGTPA